MLIFQFSLASNVLYVDNERAQAAVACRCLMDMMIDLKNNKSGTPGESLRMSLTIRCFGVTFDCILGFSQCYLEEVIQMLQGRC